MNSHGNDQQWEQSPKIDAPRSRNWFQWLRIGQASLANTLVRELSSSRQIEHLERCTKLDGTQPLPRTKINEFT